MDSFYPHPMLAEISGYHLAAKMAEMESINAIIKKIAAASLRPPNNLHMKE